jgi:flagellar hook-associated protein 2
MSNSIFTGTSQFSTDFQNVITRAVSIASLPITQLNADKTTLGDQSTALSGLDTKFAALQTAVSNISSAVEGGSFEASVSDDSRVSVTLGSGAAEGNYSIDVQDAGAYASSLTSASWNAASGAARTYQLSIGDTKYDVTGTDNSAAAVAAAINAKAGDKVRATVVNVGSSDAPDYRISLRGVALGNSPVDLKYGGSSLQTAQTVGKLAQYVVNGSAKVVTSSTRSVSIAEGVNVTLLASDSGAPVDITVMRSTAALASALQSFATAYNDTVAAIDAQRGDSAGSLNGQSVVYQLSSALSSLATYSSSGSAVSGLTSLGLELQKDGTFNFNSFALMSADITNSAGVTAFLGSASSGGFLKAATDGLNGVQNDTTGVLKLAEQGNKTEISNIEDRITEQQDRVDKLQTRLQEQMASADALIASMEQQYSYLTSLFSAMDTNSKSTQ